MKDASMKLNLVLKKMISFVLSILLAFTIFVPISRVVRADGDDFVEAISLANPEDIVTLNENANIDSITIDKALTLDLNGHVLTLGGYLKHTSGMLVIKNGTIKSELENVFEIVGTDVTLKLEDIALQVADGHTFILSEGAKLLIEDKIFDQEGFYSLQDISYVAKINDVSYRTLDLAIKAANNNDTVTLINDTVEQAYIPSGLTLTLDLNGHSLTAPDSNCAVYNVGNLTIIDTKGSGKIISTGSYSIMPYHDSTMTLGSKDDENLNNFTVEGLEGAVFVTKNTNVTINGGNYIATDNAVLITNGTANSYGGNTITVNGGIFTGKIKSAGYVACGIYAPNNDTWILNGGTFNIENGAGIVQRSGKVIIPSDSNLEINTTGDSIGKVGDSRVVVKCSAFCYDIESNYPTLTADSKTTIAAGKYTSQTDTVQIVGTDKARIEITGGRFSDDSGNKVAIPDGKHLAKDNDEYYTLQDILVSSIALDFTELELYTGDEKTLLVTVLPEDAADKSLTWSSSDDNVVTVNQEGKITAIKAGEATITVTTNDASDLSAECKVVVKQLAESLQLNKTELELNVDEYETLIVIVLPEDVSDKSLTWKSSNEEVATVDENGLVTALKAGETTITVSTNDGSNLSATCLVKVVKILKAPVLKSIYNVKNGIDVRFGHVEGATSYIFIRITGGKETIVAEVNKDDIPVKYGYLNYTDKDVKYDYGIGYAYKVVAKNDELESVHSNKLAIFRLNEPTITKLEAKSNSIKVTWGKENVHKYILQYSSDGVNWTTIETTATYRNITGLESNTTYYFRVRGVKVQKDGTAHYSQYSKRQSASTK